MKPEEKARVLIDRQLENAGWQVMDRDEYTSMAVNRQDLQQPARKGYRDLKGRSFNKQIPYRVMF